MKSTNGWRNFHVRQGISTRLYGRGRERGGFQVYDGTSQTEVRFTSEAGRTTVARFVPDTNGDMVFRGQGFGTSETAAYKDLCEKFGL